MNIINKPSQNAQNQCDELLELHQSQKEQKKKKKKCHGNRKEQHKRQRLRRREQLQQQQLEQMDQDDRSQDEQIQTLPSNDQPQEYKRKRPDSNQDDSNVNRSLSQLSISKENGPMQKKKKKKKKDIPSTTTTSCIRQNEKKKSDRSFQSHYLQGSNRIFEEILANAVQDGDQLVQYLNTEEKLEFIRRMTNLTNQAQYFDLQRHLWQDYNNLCLKEGQWAPRVSKSFAQQHQLSRTYGYTQNAIEKRQKTIRHQLQRTCDELRVCHEALEQYSKQWQPSFDANRLYQTILEYVKKNQRRLCEEFEYKRKLFEFDANGHCVIREFYQCEPNVDQVELAQKIWQATAEELKLKEYEEILRKRIYLQRLPSEMDRTINQSLDSVQNLLSNPIMNGDQRASIISTCSKTITQYKFDLMTINLGTIQTIPQDYRELLVALQNQLKQTISNETMQRLIEHRRQNMIQRHKIQLQHKLKTFFDEAPMTFDQ